MASCAPSLQVDQNETPILPLAVLERQMIVRALEYTKGDRQSAAALLGIGRTTLYRKLKEYELSAETAEAASA
jgi:DNA-binding NtrC family response regulator